MEWVLFIIALLVVAVGYWKGEQVKRVAVIVGTVVISAIVLATLVRVVITRVDWWQKPSPERIALLIGVLIVGFFLIRLMIWLIGNADTIRSKKGEVTTDEPTSDPPPYPEPIQKIESFWRRHFRKGE